MNRLEISSRIALLGLTSVLVCSAALAFDSAAKTTRASTVAATEDIVNDSFQTARYDLVSEESLDRKYRLDPGAGIAAVHRARADSLVRVLNEASLLGDASDRATIESVLRDHTRYLAASNELYAAIDRGDRARELVLNRSVVSPVFERIRGAIEARADAHAAIANATLLELRETQGRSVVVTIVLSTLAVLSLGVFLAVLLTYQRRFKTIHQAKIDKLENAARNDNLTGLGNHRAYQEDFAREVARAQRYGETLTLALLDVDDFKVANDQNGHMHGDSVLIKLADLLGKLRREDRAYRIGGDEFAVILPHTSIDRATETMQRIGADVRLNPFGCTVSIGLATLTGAECGVVTLQAQADAAMYTGKRAGRNGVTVFDPSLADMWHLSPDRIHNLHELIAAGPVPVAFQPIWDVRECRVLAYEALARPDPKYGFNGPQEAFDLAERIGCAHELDAICRKGALAAAGEVPAGALLFINVSPQSLDHGRLDPHDFVKAVRAAGLTPQRVVIEITERSISRVGAVIDSAQALQKLGFRLALDDTGSGNSGLEMLSRLPLEFVKIDREVIVKALEDKNARGVLAGIVAIADSTGAYVIAEGIETREMLDFVCRLPAQVARNRGIHGVQGFLLRRPSEIFPLPNETKVIEALLKGASNDAPIIRAA